MQPEVPSPLRSRNDFETIKQSMGTDCSYWSLTIIATTSVKLC